MIQIQRTDQSGRITLLDDVSGEEIGYMSFFIGTSHILTLDHTLVYPEYEGQGYAGQLAKALVEYLTNEQLLVRPVCSYVQTYFQRHPEYTHLLASDR